jgi:hypothetical protein
MDLKDFISETLSQIAEGASQAEKRCRAVGATAGPKTAGFMGSPGVSTQQDVDVEFTVALSVNEGTATRGGIGVVAGIFAVGSQGQSNESSASTTHVKFTLKMTLPSAPEGK